MEIAIDEDGYERSVRHLPLEQAKRARWTCATCPEPVPVVAVKWPCSKCTLARPAVACRHLPYYFRADAGRLHLLGCPEHRERLETALDGVRIQRRRGAPVQHPSVIDFGSKARVVSGSPSIDDTTEDGTRRIRSRRRDDLAADTKASSTARDIARASEFFIGHPESRDEPLSVSGMDRGLDRYRFVFKNLLVNNVRRGSTQIWWSPVDAVCPPRMEGPLVEFHLKGGRRIVVDLTGWGRAAASFRRFVSDAFDAARHSRSEQTREEWTELLIFCFGELDRELKVRVTDRRKFHLFVEIAPRMSSR